MDIDIKLCDLHDDVSTLKSAFADKLRWITEQDKPSFATYTEDIPSIKRTIAKHADKRNLILIGNGGSNTSFYAFYKSLYRYSCSDKDVHIVKTMEPHYLRYLQDRCSKEETLVMPVSKSGTTIGVLESLFAFPTYPILAVTSENDATLHNLVKSWGIDMVRHPDIGGRFSGTTSCAYTPSALLGIDVEGIDRGAKDMYARCAPDVGFDDNPALQLSVALFYAEIKGYKDIFLPIYSTKLSGFLPLIVQLIHESTCKSGRGQTVFGDFAPESQHHTNQRFFGGYKDVFGVFITVKDFEDGEYRISVPDNAKGIGYKDVDLGILDGLKFRDALDFEFQGVLKHTEDQNIPHATISVDKIEPHSVGELLAFWQYVAVYSSWLRGVNPYDQPEVEFSKKHTFELIKNSRL